MNLTSSYPTGFYPQQILWIIQLIRILLTFRIAQDVTEAKATQCVTNTVLKDELQLDVWLIMKLEN